MTQLNPKVLETAFKLSIKTLAEVDKNSFYSNDRAWSSGATFLELAKEKAKEEGEEEAKLKSYMVALFHGFCVGLEYQRLVEGK